MSDTAAPLETTLDDAIDEPNDVRPVIKTGPANNWTLYAFFGLLAFGGLVLFNSLNAAREASNGSLIEQTGDAADQRIASPEPLDVPGGFGGDPLFSPESRGLNRAPVVLGPGIPPANGANSPETRIVIEQPPARVARNSNIPAQLPPPPVAAPAPLPQPPVPEPTREPARPQVVFERPAQSASPEAILAAAADGVERVKAARLRNPSLTIPQGTVIPAVLETALDSTRGGGVRALVQRNVRGFDGTKVLIPRGSRLYGEYQADLKRGQNRALVQWTRLIRPDGVTVALDSPSSDPLGRAGVKGKVDSKFFQRFGNALLQSVLDIGVGLAVNAASDGVVVALPGSTQNVQIADQNAILPTLKVKHGTSVSVFVARDLDFSSVD